MKLVLASSSPRRRELLEKVGYTFEVRPSAIPEERAPAEDPVAFAARLASEKARAVRRPGPECVLGADTVVVAPDGSVLGKPGNGGEAERMLRLLSGSTHEVITGVALLGPEGREEQAAELTYVTFHTLAAEEIAAYVATGEPLDKAGAYAIQGRAALWIPRVQGCFYNVMGLPLALVSSMLEAQGIRPA